MLDFMIISKNETTKYKKDIVEISPTFIVKNNKDLMIRGGDFYAAWDEESGLWTTDEDDVIRMIDKEVLTETEKTQKLYSGQDVLIQSKYMWNAKSGVIDQWHKYCQKQLRDNFHQLDSKITFSNTDVKKEDYVTKKLPYPLEECDISSYEEIMDTLYEPDERRKLEWAIGSIISGDSKKIQKFVVLYGSAGSGKSTFLNILQMLFEGYYSFFDSKTLGSVKNDFALEDFKSNPLVAIQHDGDLSRIEDNTKLNSIVSHESMVVNEKFKNKYTMHFDSFIFMGTNKPVRITEAKSGIIRRLIDVRPSGDLIDYDRYNHLMSKVKFELGGIAYHCLKVYEELGIGYYNGYIPTDMIAATNDFYDFIEAYYDTFCDDDYVTLVEVWNLYKKYCEYADVKYSYSMRVVRNELKNYFDEFKRDTNIDGKHVRNVYFGFKKNRFVSMEGEKERRRPGLIIDQTESIFDQDCSECIAQYASSEGTPMKKWDDVTTKLKDIDTSKLHYVRLPENHIVIDFDLKDENGEKSYEKNLLEASKWPLTYAELSKSGAGIHLHYFYDGDVNKLSRVYSQDIEVKVFTGKSSLRRQLTKCNDTSITTINSGLPLKGAKNMVDFEMIKSEKALRGRIEKCLRKEHHGATKPEVDFIFKILEDAYASGMQYDVSDMRPKILAFANNSSNQSDICVNTVSKMHFFSELEDESPAVDDYAFDEPIFYDMEVFPNLLVIVWKAPGKDPVKMINPSPKDAAMLMQFKLIGYNCRRYDNHILYALSLGYDNERLYNLSQKIISGSRNAFFGPAYGISFTDVLDFASAANKKSLKKLEIEMSMLTEKDLKKKGYSDEEIKIIKAGSYHQELGLPWDQPVPEELWDKVADYCINDVVATEAAFIYLKADWAARQILADWAGMSVNSSTNSLTTRIIFGKDKTPQQQFNYRNLAEPVSKLDRKTIDFLTEACPTMMSVTHGDEDSLLPYFNGYTFDAGVSMYCDEKVGEGGYVYAEPGMYGNVALLDVSSMHPHSAIAEVLFGTEYTKVFRDIVEGRVAIKHEDWDTVAGMLDGKFVPYIEKVKNGEMKSKDLANALKTAINSVYGLTSAKFDNAFRDNRNIDNIVAKRGALFMIDLKREVQKLGYTVVHIKTDSIKIADASPEIIEFVQEFGKKYGYIFEHEDTYDKICLVNDAVYIARHKDGSWTATGAQFAHPYVFKSLFSHKPIEFYDMCETKSVATSIYLDFNEKLKPDEHNYIFVGKVGLFCPVKDGCDGGVLYRLGDDNKYSSVTGTKGHRWLESEMVKQLGIEDKIDQSYFISLVDAAKDNISQYGDFEWFVSEEAYNGEFYIPF